MRRTLCCVAVGLLLGAASGVASAQAPAAFEDARKAYEAGQYEKARDLLLSAARIAPKNAEVFLLLGKAHYQLGQIAEAVGAWQKALQLAPGEPYAAKMLQALRAEMRGVDVQIQLLEAALAEELHAWVKSSVDELLRDKSLSDAQRGRLLTLGAEALLGLGRYRDVPAVVLEIQAKYPKAAETLRLSLLMGRAKIHLDDRSILDGRKALQAIVADHKGTAAAAVGQYELIAFDLGQGPDAKAAAALAAWCKANADHALAAGALRLLIDAHLALTRQGPRPQRDSALAPTDVAAIGYARELRARLPKEADRLKLTQALEAHLRTHYDDAGAYAAAIQAGEALLKLELSRDEAALVIQRILDRQLAVSRTADRPASDAKLSAADLAALARAAELVGLLGQEAEVQKLLQQLLGHFQSRYFQAAAHAAALQGAEALLKLPLPRGARAAVLRYLVDSCLAVTVQAGRPAPDAPLAASDVKALAYAKELVGLLSEDRDVQGLVQQLLGHFDAHYLRADAYVAAVAGAEQVLQFDMPRSGRVTALQTMIQFKLTVAMAELTRQAAAGKLPAQMPAPIREILALHATIEKEFPTSAAWGEQVALAQRLAALAGHLPPAVKVTALSVPDAWAVEIALGVVRGAKDPSACSAAIAFLDATAKRYLALPPPEGLRIGLDLFSRLAAGVPEKHANWAPVLLAHAAVLDQWAQWQFHQNIRTGKDDQNAQLSDAQKQMIALLARVMQRDVRAHAPAALGKLRGHLQAWEARGHYAAAEAAYDLLIASLPPAERREASLAVAELWIRQVLAEHGRLQLAGLKLPEKLDPALVKALKRCYDLQAGLEEGDAFLKKVREVWLSIVNHYDALEYFAAAAEAIQVKSAPPVPAADRYGQLALADYRHAEAQRELARLIRQYDGKSRIAMTPAFQAALGAYRQFISQHAGSPLADTAVATIFSIAQTFETYEAYPTAAAVYDELAKFAAKVPTLAQAAPGASSTAERAALAHAAALDAHARKALAKELADRKDKVPPAKIRPELTAAINACKQFVRDRPQSVLAGEAVRKIMAAALEYARVDAWDVAEGIFADLEQAKLSLEQPERIELCRGLCHLGKVMPDHARSVLAALTQGHGRSGKRGTARLALGLPDEAEARAGGKPGPAAKPVTAPPPAGQIALLAERLDAQADLKAGAEAAKDEADLLALAAIRHQQIQRARQVAMLREEATHYAAEVDKDKKDQQARQRAVVPAAPVLSEAELARQQAALDAAYAIFQAIRKAYPDRPAAAQARGEVLVMVEHWRAGRQWKRAAALAQRYLTDNATDWQLPQLRLGIARDTLAWASQPVVPEGTKQEKLAEAASRFAQARAVLERIVQDFASDRGLVQQAQWDIAGSFLTQARAVDQFSPTLARGQYVRAARELLAVAEKFHDHPNISAIPQMLWGIAEELARRQYYDEAMIVWNDLTIHYLADALAAQAAMRIAQTYESNLGRPLKAAETYVEINFARGGSDAAAQGAIYNIGVRLREQKRWVEALHVLETFVDSFPRHAQAGQALTMIGEVHQTNEAWQDAIAAYQRVIEEYPAGNWVREAKWAIADCRIHRSEWRQAMDAYEAYLKAYAKDPRTAEAQRRMAVAKDLARYQALVDEKGQRKAFDAQFQIARIVQEQLANPTKAIAEYRKVAANWPKTHLADDALFQVGGIYLSLGETVKGREALLELAGQYPESPLADDALLKVGQSYEAEAETLAGVTRGRAEEINKLIAQRDAYRQVQEGRRRILLDRDAQVAAFRAQGEQKQAEVAQARYATQLMQYNLAGATVAAQAAAQEVERLTAAQLADRQDKINAALRRAVDAYQRASKVAAADKADEALLQMARIYDEKLKDSEAAMAAWQEIVRQFSGTAVAEDASWRIAQYYERKAQYAEAIKAYQAFLRNYRPSSRAAAAQLAVAENYEHLGEWVKAMDAYTNYINNFPNAPLVQKAREQISWIKTYRL